MLFRSQRPPPYQRAPIGDVQESIERAIEMLRARIEARKKTWPDGVRPEPYGGDYEDESDDEYDFDGDFF